MLPIFLLHGFPFDGGMWRDQAVFLRSPEGGAHAVFTPDFPGFGPAPEEPAPPPQEASIDRFARFAHGRIEAAGGRAVVGGFSMGGYVLFSLLRHFPEAVAAAIFIDTRADADSQETRTGRHKSIADIQKNGPAAFRESMLGRLLAPGASDAAKQRARLNMERQSVAAMTAALGAMAGRKDQTDLLPQLHMPVQIIVGARDGITPSSVALAMQSRIPQAMLVQIAGAGHLAPLEQPDAVNGALAAFLSSIRAG